MHITVISWPSLVVASHCWKASLSHDVQLAVSSVAVTQHARIALIISYVFPTGFEVA